MTLSYDDFCDASNSAECVRRFHVIWWNLKCFKSNDKFNWSFLAKNQVNAAWKELTGRLSELGQLQLTIGKWKANSMNEAAVLSTYNE